MTSDDLSGILEQLKQVDGAFESYECHEFRMYREDKKGSTQEVKIVILDAGPREHPSARYIAEATTAEGRRTSGNSAESPSTALALVHWDRLDEEMPEAEPPHFRKKR